MITQIGLLPDSPPVTYECLFRAHGVTRSCGLDVEPAPGFARGAASPSANLLAGLVRGDLIIDQGAVICHRSNLLKALHAEWDAELFCRELDRRVATGKLTLTPDFRQFERLWRRDELDHALGFAKVCVVLFGGSETDLLTDLRCRRADFDRLQPLLSDEMAICLLLAYDEIATTWSYAQDLRTFYPQFGSTRLTAWMKRLAADEARHYGNLIAVIKANHADRLGEAEGLLDTLLRLDCERNEYAATFVLDHDTDLFPTARLIECRRRVLKSLGLLPAEARLGEAREKAPVCRVGIRATGSDRDIA